MSGLIDTTEMYLRTIAELVEQDIAPMRARIAERLEQTTPTVSQTVARMERDGLLTLSDARTIELTDEGRASAVRVLRRHRLAECMLLDLGLPLERVHDEACRWEHVMSDEVERLLLERLDHPRESPYGCPIPWLDELGAQPARPFLEGVVPLADAVAEGRCEVTVTRLSEDAQRFADDLALLLRAGVRPGATLRLAPGDPLVAVTTEAGSIAISQALAEAVFVQR